MSKSFAVAVFFIIWWTLLFAVLPFWVHTQDDAGEVVPGTPRSAPKAPRLLRVFLTTTALSIVLFAVFYWVVTARVITLDDIPIFR